jgi:ribosomal protein S14
MYPVELYLKVRQHCLTDGNSERQTAKDFGISRNSVRKMLIHSKYTSGTVV